MKRLGTSEVLLTLYQADVRFVLDANPDLHVPTEDALQTDAEHSYTRGAISFALFPLSTATQALRSVGRRCARTTASDASAACPEVAIPRPCPLAAR